MRLTNGTNVDPDPGSRIRDGYKIKIRIRDEHPGSNFREIRNNFLRLEILKFFNSDPDPGSGILLTEDPGWKKFRFGIRDKHPRSATLNKPEVY